MKGKTHTHDNESASRDNAIPQQTEHICFCKYKRHPGSLYCVLQTATASYDSCSWTRMLLYFSFNHCGVLVCRRWERLCNVACQDLLRDYTATLSAMTTWS